MLLRRYILGVAGLAWLLRGVCSWNFSMRLMDTRTSDTPMMPRLKNFISVNWTTIISVMAVKTSAALRVPPIFTSVVKIMAAMMMLQMKNRLSLTLDVAHRC